MASTGEVKETLVGLRTLSDVVNSVAVQLSVLNRRLMNCEKISGSAWHASVRRWLNIADEHAVSFAALPWVPCMSTILKLVPIYSI